jgi:hypothetical protein
VVNEPTFTYDAPYYDYTPAPSDIPGGYMGEGAPATKPIEEVVVQGTKGESITVNNPKPDLDDGTTIGDFTVTPPVRGQDTIPNKPKVYIKEPQGLTEPLNPPRYTRSDQKSPNNQKGTNPEENTGGSSTPAEEFQGSVSVEIVPTPKGQTQTQTKPQPEAIRIRIKKKTKTRIREENKRRKDKKEASYGKYVAALRWFNKTYGEAEEVIDLVDALLNNMYIDGIRLGDQSWSMIMALMKDGSKGPQSIYVDWEQLVLDVAMQQAADAFFGKMGQAYAENLQKYGQYSKPGTGATNQLVGSYGGKPNLEQLLKFLE